MIAYPDTSFLWAVYVKQSNSSAAASYAGTMKEPIHVSPLLVYEFRQSLRFQVWRRAATPREGITAEESRAAFAQFESDISDELVMPVAVDFGEILKIAERLSNLHAIKGGHRSFDILHVATALHVEAREFLTFDGQQRELATAEKLIVRP